MSRLYSRILRHYYYAIVCLIAVATNSGIYAQECSTGGSNGNTCRNDDAAADAVASTSTATMMAEEPTSKLCASIRAKDVRALGLRPTYFQGGYGRDPEQGKFWNWPWNWFTQMLSKFGWKEVGVAPEACSEALFKVLYADKTTGDGMIYEKYCHSDEKPGLAFGFDNVSKEFGRKDAFVRNIQEYEKAHNMYPSIIPLSFHISDEAECKAFFALPNAEQKKWISKATDRFGAQGVDAISDFEGFRAKFGDCSAPIDAPQVQEFIEPPLVDGKTWFIRTYLFIVNSKPLVALRRQGTVRLCTEPYVKRDDDDPAVRRFATICNPFVAYSHPMWQKEGGFTMYDFKKPINVLIPILGKDGLEKFLDNLDKAYSILLGKMEKIISTETASPDHAVGHYAMDVMIDGDHNVKILEFNPCMGRDREKHMEAEARIALTSLLQFGMSMNTTYDVKACVVEYPTFSFAGPFP